jgi:DNA-binding SARP family transcriptional activator
MTSVSATLLGGFQLSVDGRPIAPGAFQRPSGLQLLKLLLVTPGHRIAREVAAELIWPEADPEHSRVRLRKSVHFARRALEASGVAAEVIGGGFTMLEIDRSVIVEVDVDRLRAAIDEVLAARAAGRAPRPGALQTLADLGGADLLPDEPYEEWLLPHRERLHRSSVDALIFAATHARDAGLDDRALGYLERVLRLEPAEEEAHRLAIELHIAAGRPDAARRQLVACAAALADAFDVAPSPQLRALIDAASEAPARPALPGGSDEPAAAGLGTLLVGALVEIVSALAGDRPLTLAIGDARLVRAASAPVGSQRA